MKKKAIYIAITCFITIVASCKKTGPIQTNVTEPKSFSEIFETFWNKMNTGYVYWDIDQTNWDSIYREYKPKFEQLNIGNKTDLQTSVQYFDDITQNLIDSHYQINFTYQNFNPTSIYPSANWNENRFDFHSPFIYLGIDSTYLDKSFVNGIYITKDQQKIFSVSGMIRQDILYFSCSQFNLQEAYHSPQSTFKPVLDYFFNALAKSQINGLKGIIIDIRNNPGGDTADLNFFVSHLINQPLKIGYTKYKSGSGRLAFTPWIEATINPANQSVIIQAPIVVLADSYSKSMAELTTMAVRAIPNTLFIGETTWGATGPMIDYNLYNDGSFDVGSILHVYCSSAQFKYINGQSYEGRGFPPDIHVGFDYNSLKEGKDIQLEKAISILSNK